MSHIPYTICRSGTYYYNRRVPKHAVEAYGSFIRQALSKCPEEAEAYAKHLGTVWRVLGVTRPQYSLLIFLLFYPALSQDLLNFLKLQRNIWE